MPSRLQTGRALVGVKQSRRAIKDGSVQLVFIAENAEDRIKKPLLALCEEKGVETVMVPTMQELGKYCGIDVGAAIAVLRR